MRASWTALLWPLFGLLLSVFPTAVRAQAAPCQFVLGFQRLHDLLPDIVGDCLDSEDHNPVTGDTLQHTTNGLLVWPEHPQAGAGNWTAFTDGYHTWIDGPYGVEQRLNTARFAWEQPTARAALAVDVDPAHVLLDASDVPNNYVMTHDGPSPTATPQAPTYSRKFVGVPGNPLGGVIEADLATYQTVEAARAALGPLPPGWVTVEPPIGDQAIAKTLITDRAAYALEFREANFVVALQQDCGRCGSAYTAMALARIMAGRLAALLSGQTPTTVVNSNWAGYEATAGSYSAVYGTWVLPTPDPQRGALPRGVKDGQWIGIGEPGASDLIQAGTDVESLGNGQFRYEVWTETLPDPPQPLPLDAHAGDLIRASITQGAAPDSWQVEIDDVTTGQFSVQPLTYASSRSSVEWIAEMLVPKASANFVSVRFLEGAAAQDGRRLSLAQARARPMFMVDQDDKLIGSPSALQANDSGFAVVQRQASTWP